MPPCGVFWLEWGASSVPLPRLPWHQWIARRWSGRNDSAGFIQKSALVPKNRASRRAVSGVTPRLPFRISVIRPDGTRSRSARIGGEDRARPARASEFGQDGSVACQLPAVIIGNLHDIGVPVLNRKQMRH